MRVIIFYLNMIKRTPAATADPITPAIFGPMACINRKFLGFSSCPSFCTTLAAIGTAETPADPIIGFIFPFESLYIIFPNITPPTVPNENAINPKIIIFIVLKLKKVSALAVAPTVIPNTIVIQ